jgi:hypothetical protein
VPLTQDDFRQFVRNYLGDDGSDDAVVVELSNPQIDTAIQLAVDTFNRYFVMMESNVEYERTDSTVIQLDDDVRGVQEVQCLFPTSTLGYAQFNIFEMMYRMIFPRLPIGDWYMLRTFYEMYQRVRGKEPDWRFDASTKRLYVNTWGGPFDVFYICTKNFDLETAQIAKGMYVTDMKNLILGHSMVILGNIRGKFTDTIPAPSGPLRTDAERMREKGEAMVTEAEERLRKAQDVLVPILG